MHFKAKEDGKKNTPHLQAMELVAKVVKRESGWSSWDPWAETDSDKWLEASDLFNYHFAKFLSELLDDALGGTANTSLAEFGEAFDWLGGTAGGRRAHGRRAGPEEAARRRQEGQEGQEGRDRQVARARRRRLDPGPRLDRGRRDVQEGRPWSYTSEHEKRVAAGKEKRAVKGELHGLIPLHPKLVETLEAGGWTWLIDSTEAKDFMHFEDRKAFEAIKKKK